MRDSGILTSELPILSDSCKVSSQNVHLLLVVAYNWRPRKHTPEERCIFARTLSAIGQCKSLRVKRSLLQCAVLLGLDRLQSVLVVT